MRFGRERLSETMARHTKALPENPDQEDQGCEWDCKGKEDPKVWCSVEGGFTMLICAGIEEDSTKY